MKPLFDSPERGIAVLIVSVIVLFIPTVVGHFRRSRSFSSISAINTIAMLTLVCALACLWFLSINVTNVSAMAPRLFGLITGMLWIVAATWAIAGKKRED